MDQLTRQAILHLYLATCGFFALKFLIPRPVELSRVIGSWVKKRVVTTTQKLHKQVALRVGTDPSSGLVIGVCNQRCGSRVKLINLRLREQRFAPWSCEHCYCCGRLLPGSSEMGCSIHLNPQNPKRSKCPRVDWTSTELFQSTLLIIAKEAEISDTLWEFTRQMVEIYSFKAPASVATIVRKQLKG